MLKGTLYLIPTVIAENTNEVIPKQVTDGIKQLDYFLVENLRTARRYISSLRLGITIEDLEFEVLDKKTSQLEVTKLLSPLLKGKNIGILSESGCPGIADPGAIAVAWAHDNGVRVVPLVGPSSLMMALMASGFNGQRFSFHGYLPIDRNQLSSTLKKLENESGQFNQTQVFIEAPFRNNQLLKNLTEQCNPQTRLCVARDITGHEEFIQTKTIKEWRNIDIDLHKRPTVFILYSGQ